MSGPGLPLVAVTSTCADAPAAARPRARRIEASAMRAERSHAAGSVCPGQWRENDPWGWAGARRCRPPVQRLAADSAITRATSAALSSSPKRCGAGRDDRACRTGSRSGRARRGSGRSRRRGWSSRPSSPRRRGRGRPRRPRGCSGRALVHLAGHAPVGGDVEEDQPARTAARRSASARSNGFQTIAPRSVGGAVRQGVRRRLWRARR